MPDAKYAELRAQVVALVTDVYDRAAQIDETADAVLDLIPTHRADALATRVCRMVAELPDRNSPAEWPEAMLVTHEELRSIVLGALNDDPPTPQPAVQQGDVPHLALTEDIDAVLSDPENTLSPGAVRALQWIRTWVSVPLRLTSSDPVRAGAKEPSDG